VNGYTPSSRDGQGLIGIPEEWVNFGLSNWKCQSFALIAIACRDRCQNYEACDSREAILLDLMSDISRMGLDNAYIHTRERRVCCSLLSRPDSLRRMVRDISILDR